MESAPSALQAEGRGFEARHLHHKLNPQVSDMTERCDAVMATMVI
jgi:hypothetical protein